MSKYAALMVFLALPYKMEAVRSPLGYRKECQVGVDLFSGCALLLPWGGELLGRLLILAGILATSDDKTQSVVGLPSDI